MTLEIRKMEYSHLISVCGIEAEAFALSPWSADMFANELSNPLCTYVVGEVDNYVVAYAGMWCIIDEAHLTTIAVKDDFRTIGIGSVMLEYMLKVAVANGMHSITLEVRQSNAAAQNLYRKFGFSVTGKRKRYYKTEDAFIMTRPLQSL